MVNSAAIFWQHHFPVHQDNLFVVCCSYHPKSCFSPTSQRYLFLFYAFHLLWQLTPFCELLWFGKIKKLGNLEEPYLQFLVLGSSIWDVACHRCILQNSPFKPFRQLCPYGFSTLLLFKTILFILITPVQFTVL